ncbi:MAG: IS66 family transposase zinc-finger binding domain-containing protein [Anaerolineae bacterium]|nr:IS66 family transposase zinc-finger binding domain-containing protein [Anaerolineae bacterium]
MSQCQACGSEILSDLLPQHVAARHQVLDIPPLQAIVREVVRYGRHCPAAARKYQRAEAPQGFERGTCSRSGL